VGVSWPVTLGPRRALTRQAPVRRVVPSHRIRTFVEVIRTNGERVDRQGRAGRAHQADAFPTTKQSSSDNPSPSAPRVEMCWSRRLPRVVPPRPALRAPAPPPKAGKRRRFGVHPSRRHQLAGRGSAAVDHQTDIDHQRLAHRAPTAKAEGQQIVLKRRGRAPVPPAPRPTSFWLAVSAYATPRLPWPAYRATRTTTSITDSRLNRALAVAGAARPPPRSTHGASTRRPCRQLAGRAYR